MSKENMEKFPTPEQDSKERFREGFNKILDKERLILSQESQDGIKEQIEANKRFVCVVGKRQEGSEEIERFLKVPVSETEEIDEPFRRQILFGKFLKQDGRIQTRDIIATNLDRQEGIPYAVMETFKRGEARIGFITNPEDMELLTAAEAQSCISTLDQLHGIDIDAVPTDVREVLQYSSESTDEFYESIMNNLDERVKALDTASEDELYHQVLNRRFDVTNFKEKVEQLLDTFRGIIKNEEQKKEVLVHGDLSPSNLYVHDNGDVEFLDLEWSGICDNEAIAMITDFGNLRARAWNNKEFREALDATILNKYREEGREEIGKAIVSLGILRSHMGFAGFFENYPLAKQRKDEEKRRRESTESDMVKAWEVAGLTF